MTFNSQLTLFTLQTLLRFPVSLLKRGVTISLIQILNPILHSLHPILLLILNPELSLLLGLRPGA
jgi:hypothetical protein